MNSVEELKKQLAEVASEAGTDFNRILTLANAIAQTDEDSVRFSVDASHISRLGIELVSKQETAVAELIKNAYDADATTVDLIFKDSGSRGGVLEIIDNGHGMSREQLLNGFMRISTQDKVLQPLSVKFGRQRAGRKGIGRFATQRLGRKVVITTQLDGMQDALRLEIDWSQFEGGKDLYLISNQIAVAPRMAASGTTIRIESLRDAWSAAQIQRAYRYVANLLQPFHLGTSETNSKGVDPGFRVAFYEDEGGDLKPIADEEQSIYAHAYAKFSGTVDGHGSALCSIESKKYRLNVKDKPLALEQRLRPRTGVSLEAYPLLKDVKFTAHYFIQDELPAGTRSMVREILNRQGGIRVYRNGFRVLPYGESFDDWLGLQRSSALREVLPPHHNHNFLGFVELIDVNGDRFEETASREGLLENDAFIQLQDFVYRALMSGVAELARARGRKVFASDPKGATPRGAEEMKTPSQEAADVAVRLRAAAAQAAEQHKQGAQLPLLAQEPKSDPDRARDLDEIADAVERLGEQSQAMFEEVGMLRVLATLGLTIGEFTHEVRHALAALSALLTAIGESGASADHVTDARRNMELLQSYVRYFDDAVTHNAHRRLDVHEIRDLVNEFASVVAPTLARQGIELTRSFSGYDLFTKPMHRSEWSSVLLNLFTNSLKAIHRAGAKGKINIVGGVSDDVVYLEFSDNGDGIPHDLRERIFEAFFTTSAPPGALASDTDKLVGTGLGLKIVRDIIDAANGEIYVVDAPPGYATCIRVEVPRATEEEIGDARY